MITSILAFAFYEISHRAVYLNLSVSQLLLCAGSVLETAAKLLSISSPLPRHPI